MQSHLIPIANDLFDIAARLQTVKASYAVYYNVCKQRYEVYDGDSFAFAVPYDELDSRTIDYALQTAVQNAEQIFAEIERHNEKVTQKTIQNVANNAMYHLKENV